MANPSKPTAVELDKTPEIRIFISSTFRDMQNEREYLIKHVFPELRQICRDRGVEFTEIDLRWGVTQEEAEQGQVVKICLEEIDRCRPYFIGILGERYGWAPNRQDVEKDKELLATYPWIHDCIENGISVTEMEVLYGVLNDPKIEDHTFFYFRDPSQTPKEFRESDPALQAKLNDLKKRIRHSSFPVHENFPDPVKLGELVRNDLLDVINKNFPLDEAPSPLEQQRRAHNAYALTRRKAYVVRPHYIELLDKHAESEAQPLVIIGDSGSGKSSLISYWAHHYRSQHPDAFIITHFVGAASVGSGHLGIIQRVIEEIKERYDLQETVPTTPEDLIREFPNWLAKVQKEKLILILDALDRLTDEAQYLRWLPRHFPPHIRTIISVSHGKTLEELEKNDFPTQEITLLDEGERDQLIVSYLGQFRKSLSFDQRLAIITEEKTANPLFLRTLLEELRIFGLFEELDNRINHYVSSHDISDLFQRVLARMEHDYGEPVLSAVLRLIWASRRGLSETEMLEISGVNRLQLSVLLQALEFQLMRQNGLLDFYHMYLRQAVERRYYRNSEDEATIARSIHQARTEIADYFDTVEVSPRKAEELPWQLSEAGEKDRLKFALAPIPMFLEFARIEKYYELLGYWRKVGDLAIMEEIYEMNIALYSAENDHELPTYDALANFLYQCGRFGAAQSLFEKSLELSELSYGTEDPRTAERCFKLANVLREEGNLKAAIPLYMRALEIRQRMLGPDHLTTAQSTFHLARLEYEQGRFEDAESSFRKALDILQRTVGDNHEETIKVHNNLAHVLRERGKFTEAEAMLRKAIALDERIIGKEHPHTADAIFNLAHLLHMKGDKEGADKLFRRALDIWETIFGSDHPKTAMGIDALAASLRAEGKFVESEQLYRQALHVWERLLGIDHHTTAITLNNLAEVLLDMDQFDQSEQCYHRSKDTFERAIGKAHPFTSHPYHGLGLVNMKRGNYALAAEYFLTAYEIREKALGAHSETLEALTDLINALQRTDSADVDNYLKRKAEIETTATE